MKFTKFVVALSLALSGAVNVAEAGGCGGGRMRLFGGGRCMSGRSQVVQAPQYSHCGANYGGCGTAGYASGGCGVQQSYAPQYSGSPQAYYTPTQQAVPQQVSYQRGYYQQAPAIQQGYYQQGYYQQAPTTVAGGSDLYGFINQLNSLRAQRGLRPVGFSSALYADCCQNNAMQLGHGIGHFYMGRARRQNAAMGQTTVTQVLNSWISSPGHAAALFDPTISQAAVAFQNGAWTFNAH